MFKNFLQRVGKKNFSLHKDTRLHGLSLLQLGPDDACIAITSAITETYEDEFCDNLVFVPEENEFTPFFLGYKQGSISVQLM